MRFTLSEHPHYFKIETQNLNRPVAKIKALPKYSEVHASFL